MNKILQKSIVVIFFVIIFFFATCLLINHDKVLSTSENRVLAEFPELTWKTVRQGTFMDGFETFVNDQMTGRDWFVRLSTRIKILMGQKDINGVYIDGNKLYSKVNSLSAEQLDKLDKTIEQLSVFMSKQENVYFGIIPTSIELSDVSYPNKLNQKHLIADVYSKLPQGRTLDVYNMLTKYADDYIYYNTDHHWTTLGAYYAYTMIAEQLGFSAVDANVYSKEVVKNDFSGTTQAKLNISLSLDIIELWQNSNANYVRLLNGDEELPLYDTNKLTSSEPYAVFLGGNTGQIILKNKDIAEDRQGTHLLMIKDSYSHCLAPFFLEHYETVTLLDLRYAGMVSVQSLIQQYNFDDIIVLYNTDNIITENKFILLNR